MPQGNGAGNWTRAVWVPGRTTELYGASDGDERKEGRFHSEDNRILYQGNKATSNPSQVWINELGACRPALITLSHPGPGCWNCGCYIAAPASSSPPRFGQPGVCLIFECWEPSVPAFRTQPQCTHGRLPCQSISVPGPSPCPLSPLCCARPLPENCELPKKRPWLPSSHLITTTWSSKRDRVYASSQMMQNGAWEANFPHVPLFGGCCCLV